MKTDSHNQSRAGELEAALHDSLATCEDYDEEGLQEIRENAERLLDEIREARHASTVKKS